MKFTKVLAAFAIAASLAACGSDVPQDIVDQNMVTARLNAQKNSASYFAIQYPEGTVDAVFGKPARPLMQSDSTISKSCRNGDGWASGVIQYEGGKTMGIKCQTNGTGKGINGCMTEREFATKNYKGEDGNCQNLESLEKFK